MNRVWLRNLLLTGALVSLAGQTAGFAQDDTAPEPLEYFAPSRLLEDLIRETIDGNPGIRTALADYRAAIQKIPQVSSLPDPMVTFTTFVRSPETRVGPQTSSLMVSQRFPWFGKLDLESKMAVREASALYEQSRALERSLVASLKDVFFELAYLDEAIRVTREEQMLVAYYEELAESRYATGQGLQYGVIRLQGEVTRILNRLETLTQQRASAAGRLNTFRGRSPSETIPQVELETYPLMDLEKIGDMDIDTLFEIGEDNRPELRAALDEIERQELALERAGKERWPDLTVSAGVVNVEGREDAPGVAQPPPDNGKNVFSVTVGLNIPIHADRYRATELQAVERRSAGLEHYTAIRDEMQFQIRDEVLRLETLKQQMDLYDDVLVPQTESALASAESAYETGLVGSTELLDSERALFDIRMTQARFRADYLKALSRLEKALGTRFP